MQLIADSAGASGQYMVRSKTAPAVLFQVHVEEQQTVESSEEEEVAF